MGENRGRGGDEEKYVLEEEADVDKMKGKYIVPGTDHAQIFLAVHYLSGKMGS